MTRRRVLVVDNEATIREMLAIILDTEGYLVDQAADGEEALRAIERARPDVILLDIKMPGIDGFEFAQMYKETNSKKSPIVVITAAQSAEKAAAEIGACSYLGKPFGVDQLLATVSDCITRDDGVA
ncbi:MAG: response regulator [Candidatus Limnocylindria bacterium]